MQDNSALGRAQAMVRDLRERCPWDRAQTRDTIRPYLVEEVFELEHALAEGTPEAIREEVADLLLHLGWQLVLGEELGEFTAEQVASDLERKMRRRHPHLFDLGPAERWDELKQRERPRGLLDGLPPTLPSLLMAYRLQERAASAGFDWPDTAGPVAKVREELAEVEAVLRGNKAGEAEEAEEAEKAEEAGVVAGWRPAARAAPASPASPASSAEPAHPDSEALLNEIGDLLFAVVNLARKARVEPSVALDRANRKFRLRFRQIEELARARGIEMTTAGLDVLDRLWDEVKRGG